MNCRTQCLNLNDQFRVGLAWKSGWWTGNGCKTGIFLWADWADHSSSEGHGSRQEREAVAAAVWSMGVRIHQLNGSGNPTFSRSPACCSIFHGEKWMLSVSCRPAQSRSLKIICLKLFLGSVCAEGIHSICLVFCTIATSLKKYTYKLTLKKISFKHKIIDTKTFLTSKYNV